MCSKFLMTVALLVSVPAFTVAVPAGAEGYHGPGARSGGAHLAQRHHRPRLRMLPPEIAYRDPSLHLRPRGQPDFLIHAYLPRFSNVPMYNEPPARFPR